MNAAEKIKANYLRIALNIIGISIDDDTAYLVLKTLNKIDKLGGDFSLKDAANIKAEWEAEMEAKNSQQ